MIKSVNLLHKWTGLIIQCNKVFVSPISTSAVITGRNKYTTPIRDIILENERTRKYIENQTNLLGLRDPNKKGIEIFYENRNPRHIELCGYNKPCGFTTLYENRNFYNKLHLDMTNRHTKAYVENINGHLVCYASTTEFAIAKRLHSTTDVCAIVNIARILAERLKKTGLLRVQWYTRLNRMTEKIREFEGILVNNGIILSEPATKVLQGPSETLPPERPKRVIPRRMSRGMKNIGTINRKDKNR